jgi:transposase
VFLAKSKDGDYHQEMNSVVFLEWFENPLMPALKNSSLVVLDNASHHKVKTEDTMCRYILFLATKPLICTRINSIRLSSQCRTGVLNTSCPCKLAILCVVKIEKEYCKENCIDRSVIEPIIIEFCDDDSEDDMG